MNKFSYFLKILNTFTLILMSISCTPSEEVVQIAIEQTKQFEVQIQTAIAQTQIVSSNPQSQTTQTETTSLENTPTLPLALPTEEPTPTSKPTDKPQSIGLNQTKRISGFCEFRIIAINFGKKILPPNTSGYYRYYEAPAGSVYLDIVFDAKNLDSISKSAEDIITVKVLYDNQYTYNSSPVLVDNDGDFTFAFYGISPLLSVELHHLVKLPSEAERNSKSLDIIIRVSDQEFLYRYR